MIIIPKDSKYSTGDKQAQETVKAILNKSN
jgi:hypothetical protein